MILFLITETSIFLAGFLVFLGHGEMANKILAGTFFLAFFALFLYIIQLTKNDKK